MDLSSVNLETQRGHPKIILDGRTYRKAKPSAAPYKNSNGSKQTTYWVCCNASCLGKMKETQELDPATGEFEQIRLYFSQTITLMLIFVRLMMLV